MENEILEVLKGVAAFGGGGVIGGLIATWKLKAEMMTKKECKEKQVSCSGSLHDSMDDMKEVIKEVKQVVEKIRDDIYVIRTNGSTPGH